jgi:CBS domain-containing protein
MVESLYIIKNGTVGTKVGNSVRNFSAGNCFPISALLNKRAVNFQYQAMKSTICYRLTQSHFEYLMQQSIIFHDFILKQ